MEYLRKLIILDAELSWLSADADAVWMYYLCAVVIFTMMDPNTTPPFIPPL